MIVKWIIIDKSINLDWKNKFSLLTEGIPKFTVISSTWCYNKILTKRFNGSIAQEFEQN